MEHESIHLPDDMPRRVLTQEGGDMTLEEQLRMHTAIRADAEGLLIHYNAERERLVHHAERIAAKITQLDADFTSAPRRIEYAQARVEIIKLKLQQRGTSDVKSAKQLGKLIERRQRVLAALAELNAELQLHPTDAEDLNAMPSDVTEPTKIGEALLDPRGQSIPETAPRVDLPTGEAPVPLGEGEDAGD